MSRPLTLLLGLLLVAAVQAAPPQDLDALLEQVRAQASGARAADAARIEEFVAARDRQQALLDDARTRRAALEAELAELREQLASRQDALAEARERLHRRLGDLQSVLAAAREAAARSRTLFQESLVSAELVGRDARLEPFLDTEQTPGVDALRTLWQTLLEEMVRSGEISRFERTVVHLDGSEQRREIVRIGAFTLLAEGQPLRRLPTTGTLIALPPRLFDFGGAALEPVEGDLFLAPFDTDRGATLALGDAEPDFAERLRSGGLIAYAILALGGLALIVALVRTATLALTRLRVERQLHAPEPEPGNPLGRLLVAAERFREFDTETLGLKVDEAILGEIPRLRRGLPLLAVIAGIAPLLGLLGTVAGMIETFYLVSLYGDNDPKLLSSGISKALVTTEFGLAVAIPALIVHGLLSGQSSGLIDTLDQQGAALVAGRAEARSG